MIYAKIIKENVTGEKVQTIIHFYGDRDECELLKERLRESRVHPLSFLAGAGFVPAGDKTFILD